MHLLLVMLGGALGAGARHFVGRVALAWMGPAYPWGTLSVNIAGGFAMGLLAGLLARFGGNEPVRLLIGVGLLGGFTTFSAFSLDVINMFERGDWLSALGYAAASVVGSVAALGFALALVREFA